MNKIEEWLSAPWGIRLPFAYEDTIPDSPIPTRAQVVAALVAINRGELEVYGWGVVDGGGPYGRRGLEDREAFALMQVGHFLIGLSEGLGVSLGPILRPILEAEWDRVALANGQCCDGTGTRTRSSASGFAFVSEPCPCGRKGPS